MNAAIQTVRAYHHASKHSVQAYAPSPGFLDWDTQPDPFRRYAGASLVALPLVTDSPGDAQACTYAQIYASEAPQPETLSPKALGLFLELALGLSAWKTTGMERWALRNNPSSGNLHPTEGYLLLWREVSAELSPGLYHYAVREHALERRATLPETLAARLSVAHPGSFGALGLSSILWRDAWKYGARAYRYCQLDVGHALAAARISARVLGWSLKLDAVVGDATAAACLGLDRDEDFGVAEREHPDLLAVLGEPRMESASIAWSEIAQALGDWSGIANPLSLERVEWPQITQVLPALHKAEAAPFITALIRHYLPEPPTPEADAVKACAIIRQRRSAQRMDPRVGLSFESFKRMLHRTLPTANTVPFDVQPYPPAIQLLLFVHAVEGLEAGLYTLIRAADRFESFRAACTSVALEWEPVANNGLPLYRLYAPIDLRRNAAQFSCHQGIAGHSAFSLGMLADLGHTLETDGAWAYRRLYWEAGMIGQVLYLEAEASGLQGTGIGCFFDDDVHQSLGLNPEGSWQDLYHFTVGRAVTDPRLLSEPAYAHLHERCFE